MRTLRDFRRHMSTMANLARVKSQCFCPQSPRIRDMHLHRHGAMKRRPRAVCLQLLDLRANINSEHPSTIITRLRTVSQSGTSLLGLRHRRSRQMKMAADEK